MGTKRRVRGVAYADRTPNPKKGFLVKKTLIHTGLIALVTTGLVACAGGGTNANSSASGSTDSAPAVATSTSAAQNTTGASTDPNNPDLTAPMSIVDTPYTEEELAAAKEKALVFFNSMATADYASSCVIAVDTSMSEIQAVLGGQELQACVEATTAEVEAYDEDFSSLATTADDISVADAGDGYAAVRLRGNPAPIHTVKLSDGNVYLDVSGTHP